jgi:hypothetical protein
MTALVNSRAAVRLLGSASLRGDAVGSRRSILGEEEGPSGLLWPLSPPTGRPRVSSAYIAAPDDRPAHVRRKTSRPRAHPPSAAGGRRSLCFAQRRRRVRQQHASRNCQEWCASQTFLTGQSLQGQSPPSMLCLLRRAASVRTHAYARGRVRVCVCVRACVGLHEPHHAGAATPHIDTPKKYKKPKSGSVGVSGHVCACARACVGSIFNKTLSGPLEAFSQDCGWPIHLVPKPQHNHCMQRLPLPHPSESCPACIAAPSSIRVLPCLHSRGEKGKP